MGCTFDNNYRDVTYEVYSTHPIFDVSYLSYSGNVVSTRVYSYEWRVSFPVDPAGPGILIVKGDTVIHAIQARIYYDNKLLIEQIKEDSIPYIEMHVKLN